MGYSEAFAVSRYMVDYQPIDTFAATHVCTPIPKGTYANASGVRIFVGNRMYIYT